MKISKLGIALAIGGISFSLMAPVAHADSKEISTKVTLNCNSYLYNKNGKRIKNSKNFFKYDEVTVKGKLEWLTQNKKYYVYTAPTYHKYWLPYILIKGQAYYTTLKGQYIKVANIGKVNGRKLLTTSGYVMTKKNTVFYNANGDATKNKVKKGSKFKVTALLNLKPQVADMPGFYQVSKNKFLYSLDVDKPRIPLHYSIKETKGDSAKIILNHDSYLYNKNGKRIKNSKKLFKYKEVAVKGKLQVLDQNKKYYTIYNYQKYWLPYVLIKGQAYYTTLKGQYIKVANVGKIDDGKLDGELIATSGYVVTKKNTIFYNANGDATKNKVKKGSKFKVTALLNLKPQVADMPGFYRVSKNEFLYSLDVKEPRIDLQYLDK